MLVSRGRRWEARNKTKGGNPHGVHGQAAEQVGDSSDLGEGGDAAGDGGEDGAVAAAEQRPGGAEKGERRGDVDGDVVVQVGGRRLGSGAPGVVGAGVGDNHIDAVEAVARGDLGQRRRRLRLGPVRLYVRPVTSIIRGQ